ncbi:hypothetical protein [Gordonia polyisoprenivorans]|uniref:hypothetical protein n=1 Tax=Gordonia polyisoprenivorans TaxID=84595 RepID=UPI001AD6426A|nr:hypothetical protein [Gordonia polyisoprenivorans]QTI66728.1 hypothetical protein J6U32_13590 [Gordonia polyisoprenivorans]
MTHYLLDGRFAPITWAIGFFKAPTATVAAALEDWRVEIHGRHNVESVAVGGGLSAMLTHVEPLVRGYTPPELLVPTRNTEWTAYFAGGFSGADEAPIGGLARRLPCEAVSFMMVPEREVSRPKQPNGGRSILLIADHDTEWLNYARSVGVGQDGNRWTFEQQGDPLPFEDVSAYQRRRVKDRFTEEMLVDYAANLGLYPMDEQFYSQQGVLVRSRLEAKASAYSMTLAEARAHFDLS